MGAIVDVLSNKHSCGSKLSMGSNTQFFSTEDFKGEVPKMLRKIVLNRIYDVEMRYVPEI